MRRLVALCLAALLAASCTRRTPPVPAPQPHYVLGAPYQENGVWYYPREQYGAVLTGLATVHAGAHAALTADGEAYDPNALAVASRTIQLPAIARLTDLETGRQLVVRVNDRGPAQVGRLIAVTPRVAALLGFPASGIARVRLEVLAGESHDVADALPGAPRLVIATAPRQAVIAQSLGAPGQAMPPAAPIAPIAAPVGAAAAPPLSGQVTQGLANPGELYVQLNRFNSRRYAAAQAARVGGAAGIMRVNDSEGAGYRARVGPFATVAEADAALDQALRAGVTDARIVVE